VDRSLQRGETTDTIRNWMDTFESSKDLMDELNTLLRRGESMDDIRRWVDSFDTWKAEHSCRRLQPPPGPRPPTQSPTAIQWQPSIVYAQPQTQFHDNIDVPMPMKIPNVPYFHQSYPTQEFQTFQPDLVQGQSTVDPNVLLMGFDNIDPYSTEPY
jgi:hypothetical protein